MSENITRARVTGHEIAQVLGGEVKDSDSIERVGRKLYNDARKGSATAKKCLAMFSEMFPKQSKERIDVYSDSELLALIS